MTALRASVRRIIAAGACVGLVAALALASPAAASAPAPAWQLSSLSEPTNFTPGDSSGNAWYVITATNIGSAQSNGTTITLADTLPPGFTTSRVEFYIDNAVSGGHDFGPSLCTAPPTAAPVCSVPGAQGPLLPGQQLRMVVHVSVPATPGQVTNSATISGGGGANDQASSSNQISATRAPFGVQRFAASLLNQDGTPATQAGAHPYSLTTTIALNTFPGFDQGNNPVPRSEDPKDIAVSLPPGVVGNPQSTPQCSLSVLFSNTPCPVDSQVGTIILYEGGVPNESDPVYNLTPQPGFAGELGTKTRGGASVVFEVGVRTGGDYGLTTTSSGIIQFDTQGGLTGASVTLWGAPADPSHTAQRGQQCTYAAGGFSCHGGGQPSGAPQLPFLTNPTDCSAGSLTVGASTDSWLHPGAFQTASTTLPAMTGCDALSFEPTISVAPDTTQAGAPAGLAVDIQVPQTNLPTVNATPEVRDVSVALPQGMTVNPSGANGLGSCSDAQFAVNSPDAAACPDASKVGTVQLHTPLLDHTLPGDVYVGAPQCSPCTPQDAAAGRMVRLFIQVNDPVSGVIVKLPGSVSIDQSTGQLTTSFTQNPQLPFDELKLTLKGGPRAPLVNPTTCGTFTTTSDFTPWSSPLTLDATPSSTFDVTGCGDPNTFAPSFAAGTTRRQAGYYAPFALSFQRSDQDQAFSGLSVTLPPGLTAKLAGVPLCSDQDASAGTCPASSQVGNVRTGAGAGSEPLFLPGKAYLTGPYKGAPYGLAVVVPAIAGPYDLGTVVVRQALYIDPTDAHVTAVSDPFPTALDGIPLRLRRVDVTLDRPGFTLNPTSCDPMAITGTLSSTGGMSAPVTSRFQVGGCGDLGFSPRLSMSLTGRGRTVSGDHPTLTATLTQPGGQANIRSARVALPLSLALDTNNSDNVCSYDVAQAVHGGAVGCPASTIVGQATAVTPLLDRPLTGPVYLVQGIRFGPGGQRIRTLPSLLVPLRGQIALDLRASSAVNGAQQLVTTFNSIPDAPVSKFTLTINGGPKGLLVITGRGQSICGKAQIANAGFGAQSGKGDSQNDTMATPCGAPARLRVLSHRVSGHSLLLRVRTSQRGRLTVTGPGLRRFSRVLGAGTHTVRVALSRGAGAARLVQVHVTLSPANAQGAGGTFTVRM